MRCKGICLNGERCTKKGLPLLKGYCILHYKIKYLKKFKNENKHNNSHIKS